MPPSLCGAQQPHLPRLLHSLQRRRRRRVPLNVQPAPLAGCTPAASAAGRVTCSSMGRMQLMADRMLAPRRLCQAGASDPLHPLHRSTTLTEPTAGGTPPGRWDAEPHQDWAVSPGGRPGPARTGAAPAARSPHTAASTLTPRTPPADAPCTSQKVWLLTWHTDLPADLPAGSILTMHSSKRPCCTGTAAMAGLSRRPMCH